MNSKNPFISVIIPIRQEAGVWPETLRRIAANGPDQ